MEGEEDIVIPNFPEIAKRMKEVRSRNQKTQKYISDIMGLSRANYSRIETGRLAPNLKQMCLFAKEFNIDLNWLLLDKGPGTLYENVKEEIGTYSPAGKSSGNDEIVTAYLQLIDSLKNSLEDKNKIITLQQEEINRIKEK